MNWGGAHLKSIDFMKIVYHQSDFLIRINYLARFIYLFKKLSVLDTYIQQLLAIQQTLCHWLSQSWFSDIWTSGNVIY